MSTHVTSKKGQQSAFRTFCVSCIGTALEFYDFVIYGTAAALVFPRVFLPEVNESTATFLAFAAFGVGFFARPLGGIVFGHLGDRYGRKSALVNTLLLMGFSTLAIGFLPSYQEIGIWAPALLVVLRLVQGFAAGGEWGGAALYGMEAAPLGRRGLWGSFTSMGIGLGTLMGAAVFAIVSAAFDNNLEGIAWRIPFWIGGALVLLGLYARMQNHEDDDGGAQLSDQPKKIPLLEAFRQRPREMALCTGVAFGYTSIAYIGTTFLLAYSKKLGFGNTDSLLFNLTLSFVLVFSAPMFGSLSDRFGRKAIMLFGALGMSITLFAFFSVIGTKVLVYAFIGYVAVGFIMGATQGPIPAFLGEQFPRRVRYSGISASYQIGAALGGGTASSVAAGLLLASGDNPYAVALYSAFVMGVLAICTLRLREHSRSPLSALDIE